MILQVTITARMPDGSTRRHGVVTEGHADEAKAALFDWCLANKAAPVSIESHGLMERRS